MLGVPESLAIYWLPLNKYLNTDDGIRAAVSTWRRISDSAIPARSKISGSYINSALAKAEAQLNGYDEAILLTEEGHVAEGSGENIFLISGGRLITPDLSQDILPGITRDAVMRVAREELGMATIERQVDRTELYSADEVFMTGTAAEVTPLLEIDRRAVGNGEIGPLTKKLQQAFFEIVRGKNSSYSEWLRPVYTKAKVSTK
jgi:branched-chain amino acid aminotransferase